MNWQLISASCIGSHHRSELAPKNGQDASFYRYDPVTRTGLAVVADGCGSSQHSEVGAHLGIRILANLWDQQGRKAIGAHWLGGFVIPRSQDLLNQLIKPLIEKLRLVLLPLGDIDAVDRLKDAVARYGLFTLNGVLFDEHAMVFFCIGDGITIINGQSIIINPPVHEDPALSNAPQYLGYSVIDPTIPVALQLFRVCATSDVSSFVVASDGFIPLLNAAEQLLPGQQRMVGPVSQFWTDDKYFLCPQNEGGKSVEPVRAQQQLNLMARTVKKLKRGVDEEPLADIQTFNGLLSDDTTFIVGRNDFYYQQN